MPAAILVLLLSYVLGSLSGALLLGRRHGIDIRAAGSGNAGGTNALRTRGWRFALGVVLIDIGKGVAAAALAFALHDPTLPFAPAALALAATLIAACGHAWPMFFGFRGGKGVATLLGGLLLAWPTVLPALLIVWLLALGSSGYVGLSSMLAVATMLPLAWAFADAMHVAFAALATAFVLFTHRCNLMRLARGSEHRFERARIIARWLRG